MRTAADRPEAPTTIRTDLGAIFVSLELSRSTWLITSLSPGGGEKMSMTKASPWRYFSNLPDLQKLINSVDGSTHLIPKGESVV